MFTVAEGNEKVGVAEIVGERVIEGVTVTVAVDVLEGVTVGVDVEVDVGVGVFVHEAAVAVAAEAVSTTCSSGDGPQAVRLTINIKTGLNNFIEILPGKLPYFYLMPRCCIRPP